MAHRLVPISEGEYLEPADVVRRMRAEFEYVEADAEEGTDVVLGMIAQFQKMNMPEAVIEAHRQMLGKAIHIIASDRSDFTHDYISFTAMPGGAPFIGYSSKQHEEAAALLLRRACEILRYKSILV